jgi:SecD/SecF fusion protein
MQNKGFVKVFAALLTVVCIFYLSFSFVTRYQLAKVDKVTQTQGAEAGQAYKDSLMNEKVWLGAYTLRQCQEMEIGLGLDLKGGMNVILEVSVPDVVKTLADHNQEPAFNRAVENAAKEAVNSQEDFITLFVKEYKKQKPNASLASIFATQQLKGRVTTKSSNAEVERILRSEVDAACKNSFNVLRTRIDRFGVVQPNIQELKGKTGRIMIEMPGIKEPGRIRKLLQGSANLEFWETYDTKDIRPFLVTLDTQLASSGTTADSTKAGADSTKTAAAKAPKESKKVEAAKGKAELAAALKGKASAGKGKSAAEATEAMKKEHPLVSMLQLTQAGAGCVVGYANSHDTAAVNAIIRSKTAQEVLPKDLSLKWAVKAVQGDKTGSIFELYAIKVSETNGRAPLEGDVITTAKDEYDQYGKPCVSMSMNTDGARRWAELTKNNANKCIAIVLDGYVYSAPLVHGEISGGNSQITGNFTVEDTKDLANVLKSGKMPAPTSIVQEEIVGPSLGQESIQQGITSFIIAFVLLMFYMCLLYGFKPGMVANTALLANLFFTLGVLTSFQAALTMSGIAGMVLSLGMAVDANVLIYERTKEELKAGKTLKNAIEAGYANAFSAIFDSNFTSIITGVILFEFGTGPIRGFATTLIIGILASFFTAVFLTRIVYEHYMAKDKWQNLTFTTNVSKNIMANPKYRFMGMAHKSFTIFGIILVASFISLGVRGLSKSIDFTGGRNFVVQFDRKVSPEQVRSVLSSKMDNTSTISAIALNTDGRTIRISTNYRIKDNSPKVDSEIEEFLFKSLSEANLLGKQVTLKRFVDRDDRAGGSIISSQKVGPSIAEDVTYGAIISVVLALAAIFIYILIRFRNVAFSVGATVGLTVDTLVVVGVYSICWGWMPFSLEIDQTFIGAILTVIGYSINDKVVVFDRIREFLHLYPKRDLQKLFNDAINTTLSRTVNTSATTLLVLLCIFFLGGDSIRSFSFAMILGVVVGTLTSIFIAAPIAFLTKRGRIDKKADFDEATEVETVKA